MSYPFTEQVHVLMTLRNKAFENIVGNRENARTQHFLLFLQYFYPIKAKQISPFEQD